MNEEATGPEDDEEDEVESYEGALCSNCWSPLDAEGYCETPGCPYADYHQDDPGAWLELTDQEETDSTEDPPSN